MGNCTLLRQKYGSDTPFHARLPEKPATSILIIRHSQTWEKHGKNMGKTWH